jgi:hypothetical protein
MRGNIIGDWRNGSLWTTRQPHAENLGHWISPNDVMQREVMQRILTVTFHL